MRKAFAPVQRFGRWLDKEMRIPWTGYTMVIYIILDGIWEAFQHGH